MQAYFNEKTYLFSTVFGDMYKRKSSILCNKHMLVFRIKILLFFM